MKNTNENKEIWVEKVRTLMKMGGKSEVTFKNYRSQINHFLNYYDENTDFNLIKEEDILEFIKKEYVNLNYSSATINLAICSIRYLYSVCFKIELNPKLLPYGKKIKLIPAFLPKDDFIKIFNEVQNLKYKCFLLLAFCSGLRSKEIATVKIENIDVKNHKIKVLGKGNKERYTILPDITIKFLRLYCKYGHITRKTGYLFVNRNLKHISVKGITNFFLIIRGKHNLPKNITFHSLRHSFATYYLMSGGSLIELKSMMGHSMFNTTQRYIHFSQDYNHLEGTRYV